MKYTKEEFVRRARLRHGDKYNYDKVVYVGSQTKVEIVCPIHGSFWQEPSSHLRGYGCYMCNPYHKSNKKEFIEKATLKHNGKYDYSLVEYVNAFKKVKIICPTHGVFKQSPSIHVFGQGCPKCKADLTGNRFRKPSEVFFKEMYDMYGDKYDFSNSVYNGTHDKIVVICKKHGSFTRTPHELLDGRGCPVCTPFTNWNTETFIIKAKEIHGNKYSYEKTEYKSIHEKVCITCKEHGDFWIEPNYHINNESGCPICGHEKGWQKLSELKKYTQEQFVKKSREIHGYKYDYSKAVYTCSNDKVCIICTEHGDFWQVAGEHMSGAGCPLCAAERRTKLNGKMFKEEAMDIHKDDGYDYSLIPNDILLPSTKKVDIICQKHGIFTQGVSVHLQGCGCPHCTKSLGEKRVKEFLTVNNITFVEQYRIPNETFLCENKNMYIDFYIPEYNCFIEYNGIQHYKEIVGWRGACSLEKQQLRDCSVKLYCKNHGIKLIEIPYTEFNNIEKILKRKLKIRK